MANTVKQTQHSSRHNPGGNQNPDTNRQLKSEEKTSIEKTKKQENTGDSKASPYQNANDTGEIHGNDSRDSQSGESFNNPAYNPQTQE